MTHLAENSWPLETAALPTVAQLETMLAWEWEARIMGRRQSWLYRLVEAVRDVASAREHGVSQRMLRRLQGISCQMPEGDTRTLRVLAEVSILAPTSMRIARYRVVFDPTSLKPSGFVTAGVVPVHGGVTRLFKTRFIGTRAVTPLSAIHRDFEPIVVDAAEGMLRAARQIAGAANTNAPPVPDPSSRMLRLVHSR